MQRTWMLQLCKPGCLRTERPFPFRLSDGQSWDVATNAHAILAVQGATWPERDDLPEMSMLPDLLQVSEQLPRPRHLMQWAFGAGEKPEDPGTVQGEWFNRWLVYRYLSAALVHCGPEFTVGRGLPRELDQLRSLVFRGPGWVLHVLGLNADRAFRPLTGPELYSEAHPPEPPSRAEDRHAGGPRPGGLDVFHPFFRLPERQRAPEAALLTASNRRLGSEGLSPPPCPVGLEAPLGGSQEPRETE